MKIYCKCRDILIEYDEFYKCSICIHRCETLTIIRIMNPSLEYEEVHNILVKQYVRKQKLKRILDETIL
jgi:hypothetical protein